MSDDNNKRYFHFTLGPVQGFVAQARRTRDFWAGSFMLSWLSAVAMQASIAQRADIKFPASNSNYLAWLTEGEGDEKKRPRQGSVPNRFKAAIDENFKPQHVVDSVQKAWKSIADIVYERDIEGLENSETKRIWDRQIENFWDMSWVIAEDEDDSSLLDRRKNWRSYTAPPEAGVKCMMMDGFQELSGTATPHQENLELFWKKIRENKTKGQSKGILNDLYEGEALCAIAFVKRRFPRYFDQLSNIEMPSKWRLHGWMLKGEALCVIAFVKRRFPRYFDQLSNIKMPRKWRLHGWTLKSDVPSVSYMAAVHWLEDVMIKAKTDDTVKQQLLNFDIKAYQLTRDRGGWGNEIRCIRQLVDSRERQNSASHDGNVFFPFILENKTCYPTKQGKVKDVIEAFAKLKKAANAPLVTPFYAVLMMDGDSLGKQMSVLAHQAPISNALGQFTQRVEVTVDQHNGFLIYAGGDDVLAILPLEDALKCAKALRDDYTACFENTGISTTLSGAIEYVHIKTPLTKVLRDAHDLLDNIAKEKVGRDALAIRVWKPGGAAVKWAQPWEIALSEKGKAGYVILQSLVETFQDRNKEDPQFSNKFFYKIRQRFDLLNPPKPTVGEDQEEPILSEAEAISLMAMEYINSSSQRNKTIDSAEQDISPLLEQCRPCYRVEKTNSDEKEIVKSDYLYADGALLLRFLVQKGVE